MSSFIARIVISLPTEDRVRSYGFYRRTFGFEPVGELAEDGVPEPLQLRLDRRTTLMFIPSGGFGWVLGDRAAAEAGTSETILAVALGTTSDVDSLVTAIRHAGGPVLQEPTHRPWGYTALCADPDGHVWQVLSDAPPAGQGDGR